MKLQHIPISSITTPAQVRTRNGLDEASLRELAASIASAGLLQPITVNETAPGAYTLVAGERRLLASTLAGLQEIPALVRPAEGDARRIEDALIENVQRADLCPLDIAEALKQLSPRYRTARDLAKAVGRSPAWVSKHLSLNKLPDAVRAFVDVGVTDPETLTMLAQVHKMGPGLLAAPAAAAEAGTLTRSTAAEYLAKLRAKHAATPRNIEAPRPTEDGSDDDDIDEGPGNNARAAKATHDCNISPPVAMWLREVIDLLPSHPNRTALSAALDKWASTQNS